MNMKQIINELITSLEPCKDRHENYLKYYANTSFSIKEFLQLEQLTYTDKTWVWKRIASKDIACKWALACASTALHIFEAKYPNDRRPREALEALEQYIKEPTEENKDRCKKVYIAADAAADAATAAAYTAAAYAVRAADAAADAAYAAYAAADAATDAAYTAAAYAVRAAYAAADAATNSASKDRKAQEELNLRLLTDLYD
jgi:hypothetical protein